jgi:hypothetical protein
MPNLRPNPLFDDITLIESRATSKYDALQVKFLQRFDKGFSVLSSYTYGKSTDDASGFFPSTGDPNFPQDSRNVGADTADQFRYPHRFSTSFRSCHSGEAVRGSRFGRAHRDSWGHGAARHRQLQHRHPFTVALRGFDSSNTGRSTLASAPTIAERRRECTAEQPFCRPVVQHSAFAVPEFAPLAVQDNILDGQVAEHQPAVEAHYARGDMRLQLPRERSICSTIRTSVRTLMDSPTFGRIVSADSPPLPVQEAVSSKADGSFSILRSDARDFRRDLGRLGSLLVNWIPRTLIVSDKGFFQPECRPRQPF